MVNQEALANHRDRLWAVAAHAYDTKEDYWLEPKVAEIAKDQTKQRLKQDPWMEIIGQKMAAVTEASIRDAFNACFADVDEHNISKAMNGRMRTSLLLAGWL